MCAFAEGQADESSCNCSTIALSAYQWLAMFDQLDIFSTVFVFERNKNEQIDRWGEQGWSRGAGCGASIRSAFECGAKVFKKSEKYSNKIKSVVKAALAAWEIDGQRCLSKHKQLQSRASSASAATLLSTAIC